MQTNKKYKIAIAVTGASGAIYAKILLEKLAFLKDQINECGLVFSENAKSVWEFELGNQDYKNTSFKIYEPNNFYAPFASGSSGYDIMIVCPCTMGTLGRIASGVASDLITRTADVMLKERKKLILVARETPMSLIHINNMKLITEAGGIICPANPSFYSKPKTIEELVATVIDRVLDLAGFENNSHRWGNL
ncbi:MAG: UbiX family flavin prenyltransferase [Bacteroidetes bacterium]|nr:UbiX family flavin prenyltransferase [Bacteroidota bacterium]